MKTIHKIASFLIAILGLVHIGFTFHDYDGLSMNAAWFFGTGIAIVLAGFMNIAMFRDGGKDTVIWAMCLITNLVFLIGFSGAAFMMRQPQVFVGGLLFAITTIYSFIINPRTN
jgi:peptidoglycan/LPS O-acetylase OafA/YrhL